MFWPSVNPSGCLSVTFGSFTLSEILNISTAVRGTKSSFLRGQKRTSPICVVYHNNRPWLATLECTSEDFGVVTSVLASTYPAFLPRQDDNNRFLVGGRM